MTTPLHHHAHHPFVVMAAAISALVALTAVFAVPALAATTTTFRERFTSTRYRDKVTTTAVWDTRQRRGTLPKKSDKYVSGRVLQSTRVFYAKNRKITGVTLTATQKKPAGTNIVYRFTVDGKNWQLLKVGQKVKPAKLGSGLRWKATLTTTRASVAPSVSQINLAIVTTPMTTAEIDPCGNAIGNGSTIISGPSAPTAPQGGGDFDSTFHSLTVHPTDPNKVWIGTERNGVLYTADGGTTWSRYRYGIRHIGTAGYTEVWNMDISTSDPTKLLIAGNDSPGPLAGDYPSNTGGIYRSIDGGQTWSRKNCGLTNGQVSSIVFDPANPNIAFAGGRSGYPSFAKAGDAVYKLYPGGIYRTTDAGANWQKVTLPGPGTTANNDFWQLIARPAPSDSEGAATTTYYSFGLNYNNRDDNVGFVKSTDGVTWTTMGSDYRTRFITDFDVSADGQHIIGNVRDASEFIISDDGGATWASLSVPSNGALAISPADPNRIIYSTHSAVRLTTDRFQTSAEKASPGAKIQDIVFAPSDPNVVYFVAAGYLFYKSTDGGATFALVKNLRSEVINVVP